MDVLVIGTYMKEESSVRFMYTKWAQNNVCSAIEDIAINANEIGLHIVWHNKLRDALKLHRYREWRYDHEKWIEKL